MLSYRFSYLSVLSHPHKPVWVVSQFERALIIKDSNKLYSQLLCQLWTHCTLILRCAGWVAVSEVISSRSHKATKAQL